MRRGERYGAQERTKRVEKGKRLKKERRWKKRQKDDGLESEGVNPNGLLRKRDEHGPEAGKSWHLMAGDKKDNEIKRNSHMRLEIISTRNSWEERVGD